MDIQARKLLLIEAFIGINDETIIDKLESVIKQENKSDVERRLNLCL